MIPFHYIPYAENDKIYVIDFDGIVHEAILKKIRHPYTSHSLKWTAVWPIQIERYNRLENWEHCWPIGDNWERVRPREE